MDMDVDKVQVTIEDGVFISFKDTPAGDLDARKLLGDLVEFVKVAVIPGFECFF